MTIYEPLPSVGNCCFCINLKVGCVLIALCGILFTGAIAGYYHPICTEETVFYYITTMTFSLIIIGKILLFIAGIVLIIGIVKNSAVMATIFMHALVFNILANIIDDIACIVAICLSPNCSRNIIVLSTSSILFYFIGVYFLIVVKSYREEMDS